jgi:hypothetical protein
VRSSREDYFLWHGPARFGFSGPCPNVAHHQL